LAIAGVPFFSGFFSKDEILHYALSSTRGHWVLWAIALTTAAITAFYMFRLVFMTFYGKERMGEKAKKHLHESPLTITIPLMVLAVLSVIGGYVGVPELMGGANRIHHFLDPVFAQTIASQGISVVPHTDTFSWMMVALAITAATTGILLAFVMYIKRPELPGKFVASFQGAYRTIYNKWYVDEIYDALFVNPIKRLGTFCWKGFDVKVIDGIVDGTGKIIEACSRGLRFTQSGFVHNYALTMVVGAFVILAFYVFR
jgi:NADH-quinone oxidoreductase subunit L